MYYLCDINNDYYDCETCLWDGICDQLTFEIPGTTYFPSENGVRKSRVYVPKEWCRYYTPLLGQENLSAVEYYQRDLDERAATYQHLIAEFQ